VIIYGVILAVLVFLLKLIEYRFFVHDLSLEFYIGIIAMIFTAVGIWSGFKLTRAKAKPSAVQVKVTEEFLRKAGISKREHEVLVLMARGLSNQEIADSLFVSLNTVKTHTSNLFVKLECKRRTQAIQKAKELNLIS
jgi:NarL family two-component system response regulator LiaR